mmetsp:Transcript_107225/g.268802  ORF Transcript_107225/g.268802 Transcript_107225/m.268802 type:complete len:295 (+) Transcript_107225:705-1589(+)
MSQVGRTLMATVARSTPTSSGAPPQEASASGGMRSGVTLVEHRMLQRLVAIVAVGPVSLRPVALVALRRRRQQGQCAHRSKRYDRHQQVLVVVLLMLPAARGSLGTSASARRSGRWKGSASAQTPAATSMMTHSESGAWLRTSPARKPIGAIASQRVSRRPRARTALQAGSTQRATIAATTGWEPIALLQVTTAAVGINPGAPLLSSPTRGTRPSPRAATAEAGSTHRISARTKQIGRIRMVMLVQLTRTQPGAISPVATVLVGTRSGASLLTPPTRACRPLMLAVLAVGVTTP